jgi:hypothetical protein
MNRGLRIKKAILQFHRKKKDLSFIAKNLQKKLAIGSNSFNLLNIEDGLYFKNL